MLPRSPPECGTQPSRTRKFLELGTTQDAAPAFLTARTLAEEKNEIERMILGQQRTDITVKD
jgi:hypothetical protein